MKTFENVQVGNTIRFNENGKIETAVVCEVKIHTFTATAMRSFDKNGVTSYYDSYYNFYKSGIKAHKNYTYGNAIEITGTI